MKKILSFTFIFVLLASMSFADDNNLSYKWSQYPDMQQSGWDVDGTDPIVLADDFMCENGLDITDIHWWGSYIGWMEDEPQADNVLSFAQHPEAFKFSMHKDVPVGVDANYSHPGETLYELISNNFTVEYYGTVDHGGVFEHVFQYNFILPDAWQQEEGSIYWLDLSAIYSTFQPDFRWGWHTAETQWNDSAVRNDPGTIGLGYLLVMLRKKQTLLLNFLQFLNLGCHVPVLFWVL